MKWADLVKKGRPINDDKWLEDWEKGAHTLYHNQNTYGICVVGNVDYPLHPLQSEALINTLGITLKRLELPRSAVKGHKDFNPTQCPGPHVYKLLGDFKQKINA